MKIDQRHTLFLRRRRWAIGRGDVRTDNSMSALTIWQDHRDIDWNWGESLSSQEQNDREERVLSCLCKVCKECEGANTARLWSDRPTFWRLKWSKLLKASPQFTGKNDKLIFCYGIGLVQIQLKLTWHFLDKYLYYCAGKYQGSMTLPPTTHKTQMVSFYPSLPHQILSTTEFQLVFFSYFISKYTTIKLFLISYKFIPNSQLTILSHLWYLE